MIDKDTVYLCLVRPIAYNRIRRFLSIDFINVNERERHIQYFSHRYCYSLDTNWIRKNTNKLAHIDIVFLNAINIHAYFVLLLLVFLHFD